jgi:hypothetical protein
LLKPLGIRLSDLSNFEFTIAVQSYRKLIIQKIDNTDETDIMGEISIIFHDGIFLPESY